MITITKDTKNLKAYSNYEKGIITITRVCNGSNEFGKTLKVLYIKPCGTECDEFVVGSTFHQDLILFQSF